MATTKPPVCLTKSGKVRVRLSGTGPQEMADAFVRYIETLSCQTGQRGITLDVVPACACLCLVLDVYEYQVVPQMRLDVMPAEMVLTLSRTEALLMWQLTMCDPAPLDLQVAWLRAMNETHQLLS